MTTMSGLAESLQEQVEPASAQIARKLRGLCAERQIRGTMLARTVGLTQTGLSRRLNGHTPFTVDELAAIAPVLGMTLGELCAIRDSNPEPADYVPGPVLSIVPAQRPAPVDPPRIPLQRNPSDHRADVVRTIGRRRHLRALPSEVSA